MLFDDARTRSGRSITQIVMLPDADRSDPENDSDSDSESQQRGCGDSSGAESLSEECVSDDDLPLSTRTKKKDIKRPSNQLPVQVSNEIRIVRGSKSAVDQQHLP